MTAKTKKKSIIIAIDGPAGVGKSTVARVTAKHLDYKFINSGMLYRALAWKTLKTHIDIKDKNELLKLAKKIKWEFKENNGPSLKLYVDGMLLYNQLRSERVSKTSSIISKYPEIRSFIVDKLRRLGKKRGIVMEGRDIASVVFPDAELKIFLSAKSSERAKRRHKQLMRKGFKPNYEEILHSIIERDKSDSNRETAPLKKTKDSIDIDTSKLTVTEVVNKILILVEEKNAC